MNDLYARVVEMFGIEYQMDLAAEEMAELIKELIKYKRKHIAAKGVTKYRNQNEAESLDAVAEEMADVYIVMEEIAQHFGLEPSVAEYKARKLKKLENNLDKMDEECAEF